MKKNLFALSIIVLMIFSSCTNPKPVKTIENLKAGIKGETTASAKYLAFAEKAKAEGLDTIANLFVATSKAEAIHAANHTKVLEELGAKMEAFTPEFEVKTTAENLQAALMVKPMSKPLCIRDFWKQPKLKKRRKLQNLLTGPWKQKKFIRIYTPMP